MAHKKCIHMKNCPFCGHKAIRNHVFFSGARYWNCGNPQCALSEKWIPLGIHFLIWNNRPAEDALQAQVNREYGVKLDSMVEVEL